MFSLFGDKGKPKGSLQVRIGPDPLTLAVAEINNETDPHFINSPHFMGHVVVRIKDFNSSAQTYFNNKKRSFSIQVSGIFKNVYSADDVVFGAVFERKVNPPVGSWMAMQVASLIDPALRSDLYCDSPWFLSPLLCSMNTIAVHPVLSRESSRIPALLGSELIKSENSNGGKEDTTFSTNSPFGISNSLGISAISSSVSPSTKEVLGPWEWHDDQYLQEDTLLLFSQSASSSRKNSTTSNKSAKISTNSSSSVPKTYSVSDRRKFFGKQSNRQDTKIGGPELLYNMEIFAPFLNFNTFDLSLGINVNIHQYMNSQPLRLVCKSMGTGDVFFVVEFDLK